MAVVVFIEVPWTETNQKRHWALELVDADGALVELPGPAGPQQVRVEGELEAGRPPGMPHGTPVSFPPLSVNVGPLPLPPGRYEWKFSVDGNSEATWRRAFTKLEPGAALQS
jgi:hypothetical protein